LIISIFLLLWKYETTQETRPLCGDVRRPGGRGEARHPAVAPVGAPPRHGRGRAAGGARDPRLDALAPPRQAEGPGAGDGAARTACFRRGGSGRRARPTVWT